ncbi:hypothetical protein M427DRAFT_105928 [Gonapodya prolifera JEL478]|uniref:RING-type domain-containing protein n=1 Tax=Gonapodya prolifera (strain JEL478) TaxID=1344416 RepID=A0A138ZYE3_GONPJ|nr:hypothetical protein M427DRAFT_105928 [Gonapodya prolifera JEL478]|eukprot:KXS09133.1 hypothetical protein M427DRAFT_105928 [Gonapodya prolifera JEL478]
MIESKSLDHNTPSPCKICLDSLDGETETLTCWHTFHADCAQTWRKVKKRCPTCRVAM